MTDVAVVFLNDAYGAGLATVFQDAWLATAGNGADAFPFEDGATNDWAATAANVAAFGPDAIMMVALDAQNTVSFIAEMAAQPTLASLPLYLTDGSKDAATLLSDTLSPEVRTIKDM